MALLLTFLFGTLLVSFLCSILEATLMSTPLSFITMKKEQGYRLDITDKRLHHEIYLSDARKVAPEKLKTVLRHPIARK